jgi:hypothetical protein
MLMLGGATLDPLPKAAYALWDGLMAVSVRARFIEPMLLLRTTSLPEGAKWIYELFLQL